MRTPDPFSPEHDDIHEPRRRTHWPKDYVESRERDQRRADFFGLCEIVLLTALLAAAILGILGLLS